MRVRSKSQRISKIRVFEAFLQSGSSRQNSSIMRLQIFLLLTEIVDDWLFYRLIPYLLSIILHLRRVVCSERLVLTQRFGHLFLEDSVLAPQFFSLNCLFRQLLNMFQMGLQTVFGWLSTVLSIHLGKKNRFVHLFLELYFQEIELKTPYSEDLLLGRQLLLSD